MVVDETARGQWREWGDKSTKNKALEPREEKEPVRETWEGASRKVGGGKREWWMGRGGDIGDSQQSPMPQPDQVKWELDNAAEQVIIYDGLRGSESWKWQEQSMEMTKKSSVELTMANIYRVLTRIQEPFPHSSRLRKVLLWFPLDGWGKLRRKEVKELTQDLKSSREPHQDLNQGHPVPHPNFPILRLNCLFVEGGRQN